MPRVSDESLYDRMFVPAIALLIAASGATWGLVLYLIVTHQ